MPAKLMPERKASDASQSAAQASSDFVGQTKTIEKERCGEVRRAHERREREGDRRNCQIGMKATNGQSS